VVIASFNEAKADLPRQRMYFSSVRLTLAGRLFRTPRMNDSLEGKSSSNSDGVEVVTKRKGVIASFPEMNRRHYTSTDQQP
jgi:hypothetical protein